MFSKMLKKKCSRTKQTKVNPREDFPQQCKITANNSPVWLMSNTMIEKTKKLILVASDIMKTVVETEKKMERNEVKDN